MGHAVNSSAFRYGISKPWDINSSKLLTHNPSYFIDSQYFYSYYFLYILKSFLFEFFGSNELKFFSIVFADCKLHDYQLSTHLNIYVYTPTFRRFFKFFCHASSKKKQQPIYSRFKKPLNFKKNKYIKKKIYKFYLKRIFRVKYGKFNKKRIRQKRIYRFFKFFSKTFFRKELTFKVFNNFFYRFFFQFFFFKVFKLLQKELFNKFNKFFTVYFKRNVFKINFFFIKKYWYFPSLIASRFGLRLLLRRSLGSLVKPFQLIFFKKNKFLNIRRKSFFFRTGIEGIESDTHKFFIERKDRVKSFMFKPSPNRFLKRMVRQQRKQIRCIDRSLFYRNNEIFRGSQEFVNSSNNFFKIGGSSSIFTKSLLSLAAVGSQNVARMKTRRKFNFKETPFFLKKFENKKIFSSIFNGITGLKIKASGRFSKKQIAETIVYRLGSVKLSNPNSRIEFTYRQIALKNSTIGFKIWLSY